MELVQAALIEALINGPVLRQQGCLEAVHGALDAHGTWQVTHAATGAVGGRSLHVIQHLLVGDVTCRLLNLRASLARLVEETAGFERIVALPVPAQLSEA